jgi:hypothetical protein
VERRWTHDDHRFETRKGKNKSGNHAGELVFTVTHTEAHTRHMAAVSSRRAVTKLLGLTFSKAGPSTVDCSGAAVPSFQRALGGFRSIITTSAGSGAVRRGLEEGKLAGSSVFRDIQQHSQAVARQGARQATRTFASSGGGHGEEVVHEGLKLHATGGWHKAVGETLSAVMWFWVFYRLYHDYEGFLFGHVGHHEHMLHEEAGHDD